MRHHNARAGSPPLQHWDRHRGPRDTHRQPTTEICTWTCTWTTTQTYACNMIETYASTQHKRIHAAGNKRHKPRAACFNPSRTPHPTSPVGDERIVRPQPEPMPARPHARKYTTPAKSRDSPQATHDCAKRLSVPPQHAAPPSQLANPDRLTRVLRTRVQEFQVHHFSRCGMQMCRGPLSTQHAVVGRLSAPRQRRRQRHAPAQLSSEKRRPDRPLPPCCCTCALHASVRTCTPACHLSARRRYDKVRSPQRRNRARSGDPIRNSDSERITAPAKSVTVTRPRMKAPMSLAEY